MSESTRRDTVPTGEDFPDDRTEVDHGMADRMQEISDHDEDPTQVTGAPEQPAVEKEMTDKERRLQEVRDIIGRLDPLRGMEGPLTVEDVRGVIPPEEARGLERWQIDKIVYRLKRILRDMYDARIRAAGERRGFIENSPPSAGELRRIEEFGAEVNRIDQEFPMESIMEGIGRYLRHPG